ncbi:MAG TPA: hypothetical protein VML54_08420 [Candidatus Limnocylindrales bacterium]|nr:hypothetical protein [Candidatus Limnocylindrales bacterium]
MKVGRLVRSRWGLLLALAADVVLVGGPHRPRVAYEASLAAALSAQAAANDRWLSLPGVVGTAVGMDASGELVVKVYLRAPGAAALPATFAGVSIVPEVTGPLVALADPPDPLAADGGVDPKRSFPRPVPIGVSTGHPGVSAGTLGARVTDGERVYALSNNHVYANRNDARRGDRLLQPGTVDGGREPDDVIGTLHDFEPLRFCTGFVCPANRIDAALALTSEDELGHATPDGGYGSPSTRVLAASLGMEVQKYGRTTGYTRGRVSGIHATLEVDYRSGVVRFEDQIVISGSGFSAPGDSGSLIVSRGGFLSDRRPVGLLFAGSSGATIANPIGPVLERFGVKIDGGER